jgi:hypothetical protein
MTVAAGIVTPGGAVGGMLAAAFGIPLGIWAATGVRYGRVVVRTTMATSIGTLTMMAFGSEQMDRLLRAQLAEVERRFAELDPSANPEGVDRILAAAYSAHTPRCSRDVDPRGTKRDSGCRADTASKHGRNAPHSPPVDRCAAK